MIPHFFFPHLLESVPECWESLNYAVDDLYQRLNFY